RLELVARLVPPTGQVLAVEERLEAVVGPLLVVGRRGGWPGDRNGTQHGREQACHDRLRRGAPDRSMADRGRPRASGLEAAPIPRSVLIPALYRRWHHSLKFIA